MTEQLNATVRMLILCVAIVTLGATAATSNEIIKPAVLVSGLFVFAALPDPGDLDVTEICFYHVVQSAETQIGCITETKTYTDTLGINHPGAYVLEVVVLREPSMRVGARAKNNAGKGPMSVDMFLLVFFPLPPTLLL